MIHLVVSLLDKQMSNKKLSCRRTMILTRDWLLCLPDTQQEMSGFIIIYQVYLGVWWQKPFLASERWQPLTFILTFLNYLCDLILSLQGYQKTNAVRYSFEFVFYLQNSNTHNYHNNLLSQQINVPLLFLIFHLVTVRTAFLPVVFYASCTKEPPREPQAEHRAVLFLSDKTT